MAVQNNTMTLEELARAAQQGVPRALAGVAQAATGTLARPVTAVQDAARVGATRLLGGDPATLAGGPDMYTQRAQQLTQQGISNVAGGIGGVVAPVQQAALSALGAQPASATAQSATPPATPPATPQMTPAAQPQPTAPTTMPARSAADLEAINAGLAYNVAATQTPAQRPMERGNYNVTNTSNVDAQGNVTSRLRQPDNIISGGNAGFGEGGARGYLDRMAAQDAQERARVDQQRREAQEGVQRIGLRNAATSGSVQESMVARRELAALNQAGLQRQQDLGALQRTGMQTQAELQRANIAGQFGLQQEAMRGQNALQQADITGQYGLAGREALAQSRLIAAQAEAQSGSNLRAQAEAMRLAQQQAIAADYEAAGDFAGRDRALGISQPSAPRLTQDALGNVIALDGRPVSAAEAEAYRQSIGFYKTPTQ